MIPHKIWGHHQPDVSDHPEHDGDAPDGVVAVPLLLLGHQDEPEVGQDVGAQHLSVVYLSLLVFLRSECRNTQLCGWCQLVWRNSGNCDRMLVMTIDTSFTSGDPMIIPDVPSSSGTCCTQVVSTRSD